MGVVWLYVGLVECMGTLANEDEFCQVKSSYYLIEQAMGKNTGLR